MVGKVARKDRCQMQIPAFVGGKFVDVWRKGCRQCLQLRECLGIAGFQKDRNLGEVDTPFLRERLHGIEHAIVASHSLKQCQRHRACRMGKILLFPTLHQLLDYVCEHCILDGNNEEVGLVR